MNEIQRKLIELAKEEYVVNLLNAIMLIQIGQLLILIAIFVMLIFR